MHLQLAASLQARRRLRTAPFRVAWRTALRRNAQFHAAWRTGLPWHTLLMCTTILGYDANGMEWKGTIGETVWRAWLHGRAHARHRRRPRGRGPLPAAAFIESAARAWCVMMACDVGGSPRRRVSSCAASLRARRRTAQLVSFAHRVCCAAVLFIAVLLRMLRCFLLTSCETTAAAADWGMRRSAWLVGLRCTACRTNGPCRTIHRMSCSAWPARGPATPTACRASAPVNPGSMCERNLEWGVGRRRGPRRRRARCRVSRVGSPLLGVLSGRLNRAYCRVD